MDVKVGRYIRSLRYVDMCDPINKGQRNRLENEYSETMRTGRPHWFRNTERLRKSG